MQQAVDKQRVAFFNEKFPAGLLGCFGVAAGGRGRRGGGDAEVAGLNVAQFSGSTKLKNQFKRADQSGAAFAVIIAENEVTQNTVTIKDLRGGRGQTTVAADELVQQLNEWSTQ